MANSRNIVLVIGATGYFGRLLVDDLLQTSHCQIVAASRTLSALQQLAQQNQQYSDRLSTKIIDLAKPQTIADALEHCQIVVCAAGPFQDMPLSLAQQCMAKNIPYIDLADDREYVMQVRKSCLDSNTSSAVCSGWSAMPALTAIMTKIAAEHMDAVEDIYIGLAPGNRAPRGSSTVSSLLSSVGKKFSIYRKGRFTEVTGWSDPRVFKFPPPVGERTGYLIDVPDHELLPGCFGAQTTEFRVSPELSFFNIGLSLLAQLRVIGMVKSWQPWTPVFRTAMSTFGAFGHAWGAVGVEVHGTKGSNKCCVRVCLLAEANGQRIPVMPASVMCQRIISPEEKHLAGLVALDSWIDHNQLKKECASRGYKLVIEVE